MSMTPSEFSRRVKHQYPQYEGIDDEQLARAIVDKYPQYKLAIEFGDNPAKDIQKQIARFAAPRVAMAILDQEVPDQFLRSGRNTAATAAGLSSAAGGALRSVGLEETGKGISEPAERIRRDISVKDPTFLDEVEQAAASTAFFLIPGLGIARGVGVFAALAPSVARLTGLTLSTTLEAGIEGGEVFNDQLRRGKTKEEAAKNAHRTFALNVPLIMLTEGMGQFRRLGKFGIAGKTINTTAMEGLQEGGQQSVSNFVQGDPFLENTGKAALIGGLVGGPSGAAIGAAESQSIYKAEVVDRLISEAEGRPAVTPEESAARSTIQPDTRPDLVNVTAAVTGSVDVAPMLRPTVAKIAETVREFNQLGPTEPISQDMFGAAVASEILPLSDLLALERRIFQEEHFARGMDPLKRSQDRADSLRASQTPETIIGPAAETLQDQDLDAVAKFAQENDVSETLIQEAETMGREAAAAPARAPQAGAQPLPGAVGAPVALEPRKTAERAVSAVSAPPRQQKQLKQQDRGIDIPVEQLEEIDETTGKRQFEMSKSQFNEFVIRKFDEAGRATPSEAVLERTRGVVISNAARKGYPIPASVLKDFPELMDLSLEGQQTQEEVEESTERAPSMEKAAGMTSAEYVKKTAGNLSKEAAAFQHEISVRLAIGTGKQVDRKVKRSVPRVVSPEKLAFVPGKGTVLEASGLALNQVVPETQAVAAPIADLKPVLATAMQEEAIAFRAEIMEGRPATRAFREGEIGGDLDVTTVASSYPVEYTSLVMDDRLDKTGVITALDKIIAGEGDKGIAVEAVKSKVLQRVMTSDSDILKGETDAKQDKSLDEETLADIVGEADQARLRNDILLGAESALEGGVAMDVASRLNRGEAITDSTISFGVEDPVAAMSPVIKEIEQLELNFDKKKLPESSVVRELKSKGFVDFRGKLVRSARDVAEIHAVVRDARVENLSVIFLLKNRIVSREVFSSGLPNAVAMNTRMAQEMKTKAERLGADGIWIAHNHPSGNATASTGDKTATIELHRFLGDLFKGHVVTDDTEFSSINIKGRALRKAFKEPKEDFRSMAVRIRDMDLVSAILSQDVKKDNVIAIMFLDTKLGLLSVDTISPTADINTYIKQKKRAYGAVQYVVAYSKELKVDLTGKLPSGLTGIAIKDGKKYVFGKGARRRSLLEPGARLSGERRTERVDGFFRVAEDVEPFEQPLTELEAGPQEGPEAIEAFETSLNSTDRDLFAETRDFLARQTSTRERFTDRQGNYNPDRVRSVHNPLIKRFDNPDAVVAPGETPTALVVIGPPAAGKSTILKNEFKEHLDKSVLIDNDEIKVQMPGFSRTLADTFHQESSDIEKKIVKKRASERKNLTFAIIGKNQDKVQSIMRSLKAIGYEVNLVLVDLPPIKAAARTVTRFREGGRFVDPRYIIGRIGLTAQKTYVNLRLEADNYARFSSDVPFGERPRVLESSFGGPGRGGLRGDPTRGRIERVAGVQEEVERIRTRPARPVVRMYDGSKLTLNKLKATLSKDRKVKVVQRGGKVYAQSPGRPEVWLGTIDPTTAPPQIRGSAVKQQIKKTTGLQPGRKVSVSETFLLRLRLRSQVAGARIAATSVRQETRRDLLAKFRERFQAFKVGAKEKRLEAIAKLKHKAEDIAGMKKELIDYIVATIPLASRGKFLAAVRDAKTPKSVARAFVRADTEAAKIYRKQLLADIKKSITRIQKSGRVGVEYKQRLTDLLEGMELQGHTAKTLARLDEIQGFIDRQKAKGIEAEMPQQITDRLKILTRAPLTSIPTGTLESLALSIEDIERLGRTSQRVREELFELERDRLLSEIIPGTVAINKSPQVTAGPGETVPLLGRIQNYIGKTKDFFQHIDLAISPMDVVFDLLDGVQGYAGRNMTLIKKRIDGAFGGYLDQKDVWTLPVQELAANLGMNDANMERISVHAYRVQPNGLDYLSSQGLTEQEIDAIVLTKNEETVYQAMRQTIERPYARVREVLKTVYNRDIGKIDNYFPIQTDFEKSSEVEVFRRLGDALDAFGRPRKTTEQGFTKQRIGGNQRIKLNAMDVFTRHIDDVAYFVAMQRDLNMVSSIINTPEYGQAAGEVGQRMLLQWLDVMARKGGASGANKIAALDAMRRNVGAATLGLKLSSTLIQPTALFDGMTLVGGPNVLRGMTAVSTSREWRQFLSRNFPELRNRGADDPAFLELSTTKWLAKAQAKGFLALQFLDLQTASAVTAGAYIKSIEERGGAVDLSKADPQAIEEATLSLRRTQNSAFFKDLSLALSRGGLTGNVSFDKALFQFKSFVLNRWSLIRHDAWRAGIRKGNISDAVWTMNYLSMATAAEVGIRNVSRSIELGILVALGFAIKEADDKFEETFGEQFLREMLGNVPFLGDMVSIAIYKSVPIPAIRPIINFPSGVRQALTGSTPQSRGKGLIRAIEGIAVLAGIPGVVQASRMLRMALQENRLVYPFSREMNRLQKRFKAGEQLSDRELFRLDVLSRFRKNDFAPKARKFRKAMELDDREAAEAIAKDVGESMKVLRGILREGPSKATR